MSIPIAFKAGFRFSTDVADGLGPSLIEGVVGMGPSLESLILKTSLCLYLEIHLKWSCTEAVESGRPTLQVRNLFGGS